jgi:hypothetical protein
MPYSVFNSPKDIGSEIEEELLKFCMSAQANPRVFVIATKQRHDEITRFLIIVVVIIFPALQLL